MVLTIGDKINYYGREFIIVDIHGAGTIDVSTLDGKKYFRITGLNCRTTKREG